MILKGSTISNVHHARLFAAHLFKSENEIIQVRQSLLGGEDRQDVEDDLVNMQLFTDLTRGKTGIFHVAIDPRKDEQMTPDMWDRSLEVIEEEFGLENQMRIQIYHKKEGRSHVHTFWSLVDTDRKKLIQLRFFKRRLQSRADQLELEFGHERTPRLPSRTTLEISEADRIQKLRTGKNPKVRKQMITALWEQTTNSQDFLHQLQNTQYVVVKGDRCKYGLVDQDGRVYNLARQLPRLVKQKDIHSRLKTYYQALPSISEGKEMIMQRKSLELERVRKLEERLTRLKTRSKNRDRGLER